MKLVLSDTKMLKDSVSIIADLVTEVTFEVSNDAIELVAMDPANVAMVVFKLLSSSFVEYDVDEKQKLSINLNDFKQVLKRGKSSDTLTLELSDNKLKTTFKGNSTREFYLPLIELEEKEQNIPDLEFDAVVKTSSTVLNDAVEDVDIIGDSVVFRCESSKLEITASSDLTKADIEIKSDDDTEIDCGDTVKSKYSIEYLKKIIKASKLADDVSINFGEDYPMKLEYKQVDKMKLDFILAPRVDND